MRAWYRVMLNDAKIRAAKPQGKPYKLADSGQLYLYVSTAGGRHWRMNYMFGTNANGRPAQKTLSFGSYPAITLLKARELRDEAKALLFACKDPASHRKNTMAASANTMETSFEAMARAWHGKQTARWSKVHAGDVLTSLEENVFPIIGGRGINDIRAPELLSLLTAIEKRGAGRNTVCRLE